MIIMKRFALLFPIAFVLITSGCTNLSEPTSIKSTFNYSVNSTPNSTTNQSNITLDFLVLATEGTINPEDCSARGLGDKVIVLESRYCGACRIAVPRLKEIEKELQTKFIFLDLSQPEDRERLKEFKILPQYTPTVLVGCDVYIGAKSKEEYKRIIEKFLGR